MDGQNVGDPPPVPVNSVRRTVMWRRVACSRAVCGAATGADRRLSTTRTTTRERAGQRD